VCVCVFVCMCSCANMKTKPLLFLLLAFLYDAVLYWYIYTRLPDGAKRADILGLCSSLVTTVIMTLPAIEVVSMSPFCLYQASSTVLCMYIFFHKHELRCYECNIFLFVCMSQNALNGFSWNLGKVCQNTWKNWMSGWFPQYLQFCSPLGFLLPSTEPKHCYIVWEYENCAVFQMTSEAVGHLKILNFVIFFCELCHNGWENPADFYCATLWCWYILWHHLHLTIYSSVCLSHGSFLSE